MSNLEINPLDYIAIQNTIAKYCFALDSKDFGLLDSVFTEDITTVYPFRGESKGLRDIADAIKKRSTSPPILFMISLTAKCPFIDSVP